MSASGASLGTDCSRNGGYCSRVHDVQVIHVIRWADLIEVIRYIHAERRLDQDVVNHHQQGLIAEVRMVVAHGDTWDGIEQRFEGVVLVFGHLAVVVLRGQVVRVYGLPHRFR